MSGAGAAGADVAEWSVSVLMSTYARETAEHLDVSLTSLAEQTCPADRIVLVVDGPVGPEQEAVIARHAARGPSQFTLVRIPQNVGLAAALNLGLGACSGRYTMRMDSDDVCEPDRIQLQRDYALRHPDVDVVSSWSCEFFEDGAAEQLKVSPVDHDALARAMRWRNVLVHPTICVRTETLRAVGGYRPRFGMLEDYDLFVRLLQHGARFHVIPKALVRVRSSAAQKARRGGWRYCLNELRFRRECLRTGFLSLGQFLAITSMYVVFRLASAPLRRRLYALARS
jgi:GT2 family glycosyltransferase